MATQPQLSYTADEYLGLERDSETRNEYHDGQIMAMTGGTGRHNLILLNIAGELRSLLKGSTCRAYGAEMRLKIQEAGLYTYPDVMVVCKKPEYEDGRRDTLLNPSVIIEVLSKSTEAYDRGDKFGHYQTLKTLNEYLLVSQKDRKVERFVRKGDGFWLLSTYTDKNKTVPIESLKQELALSEIYDGVEWGD